MGSIKKVVIMRSASSHEKVNIWKTSPINALDYTSAQTAMLWSPLHTCCERNHPKPCKGHQCVMEPVADGCSHTSQQAGTNVLDGQTWGHVWGVDWGGQKKRVTELYKAHEPPIKACLGHLTLFNIIKWLNLQCHKYLLGVKANLCLHNSQYSFLLCFSHWTKL